MKLAIIVILFAVCASMVYAVPYNTYCNGLNEVFSTCGSACPATCDSYLYGGYQGCGSGCQRGCFCRPGYVRNTVGVCIEEVQCSRRRTYLQQSVGYYPFGYYGIGWGY
ncbi:chymotrypsin-elastase inhibitor ixodidin-like [Wyeomyia smithii]|uniref:chymotrypsin-elastase inhibitor ixodidin-like n=1 Tax=Wyeomyia smithii TaxID=174621 RepID=UPI002467CF28|nr:chymotrypsin-elastase inhibitor ixodidin-like [Wyeomyia smithii]